METADVETTVTVAAAVPLTVPIAALIVVVPGATPLARPEESMVAAEVLEDVQAAVVETLAVVPLL
jgi:hypothetical protein